MYSQLLCHKILKEHRFYIFIGFFTPRNTITYNKIKLNYLNLNKLAKLVEVVKGTAGVNTNELARKDVKSHLWHTVEAKKVKYMK